MSTIAAIFSVKYLQIPLFVIHLFYQIFYFKYIWHFEWLNASMMYQPLVLTNPEGSFCMMRFKWIKLLDTKHQGTGANPTSFEIVTHG